MCESIQISIQNGPPQMTAGKGPPFLRHLLGGSAKVEPGITSGLAGAVQGSQGGPQDRPRPSGGCAGDPPYRGRPERAGICAYERILFIRAGRWARKLPGFRYFCWKSQLRMVLAKFSCFKMCESIQISIQNGPPQMTAGKGPPFLRHLLGGSARVDPGIAPGPAGAVQGSQGGPRDRPRPSRGCAGEPPYRGRAREPGLC